MAGHIRTWDGNEWQNHVLRLLRHRYGELFVEVPHRHCGDLGLEGFSRSTGYVYQCYAPEEPLQTKERYEKQRDKITEDLTKLVDNSHELQRLLGPTVINGWLLVVPHFDSVKVQQHAQTKATEVLQANLPYVSKSFFVNVISDDFFEVELQQLTNIGLSSITIPLEEIEQEQVDDWVDSNQVLVQTMDRKIGRIPAIPAESLQSFRRYLLENYLAGLNALDSLRLINPDSYESAIRCKGDRERFLRADCLLASTQPNVTLQQEIERFINSLQGEIPSLNKVTAEVLAWEAVADWLLRCPLNFPEARNG